MDLIITEWGLQSYLDLKGTAFTDAEYWSTLRPDVELLKSDFPHHAKFSVNTFWGPAKDKSQRVIADGYKMKWHNIGPGRVQLRLCVALHDQSAFLCQAFVKSSPSVDLREMAKFKNRIDLIRKGRFQYRGRLP